MRPQQRLHRPENVRLIVDHEQRRSELAEAGWTVIRRDGLQRASVRNVAREAGWSMGSLRHYFATQSELLCFAMQLVADRARARVRALEPAPDPRRAVAARAGAAGRRAPRRSRGLAGVHRPRPGGSPAAGHPRAHPRRAQRRLHQGDRGAGRCRADGRGAGRAAGVRAGPAPMSRPAPRSP